MEKKCKKPFPPGEEVEKIWRKMKLTALFILLVFASFANSFSQSTKLTLNYQGVDIREVLQSIEDESNFIFLYKDEIFDFKKKYSLNVENERIENILEAICKQANVDYEIRDRQIILKEPSIKLGEITIQQKKTVEGNVTDSSGIPLPGVTVVVKGTTQGTITDPDGNYSLSDVPSDAILVFSFVGMKTLQVPVAGKVSINAVMEEDSIGIEEVVAIGYGSAKKRDVTGAMGSVRSEEITRTNPVQPTSALQGTVAGVNVNKRNSRPGAEYTIDIRGLHSIDFSSEPLVVIDGVMGGRLSTLNPSDIESMDVLKDASATAIYGARGANGVIIVTTKKGISGKTKVTYDGYVGVKVPSNLPDLMTAQEFYHAYNDVVIAEKPGATPVWTTAELANIEAGKSADWVDLVTDPSVQTSHVVALSGGNENATHYFSAGYLSEKGNLLYTGYERFNLKGSIESKLNDVVKVGFNSYYTYSIQNLGSNEALRAAYRVRPTGTIYYDDLTNPSETSDKDVDGYAFWMGIKDKQIENPLHEVQRKNFQDETRVSSFLGNGFIELTPLKGLSFKSSLSTSVYNSRHGVYKGTDTKSRINKLPVATNSFNLNTSWTWDNILNYKLKTGVHDFNITAAQSALKERFESAGTNVENLPYNSRWYAFNTAATIKSTASNLVERSIFSFMGRVNYIYDDRYLLTLTGRYDGSSVLAIGNKWAFFPSLAFAWRAGEEQFIKDLNLFSDLKVRLSYGQVGNDVVQPYSTQAYLGKTSYDFNGTEAYGYTPNNIGNADLKWENSSEVNFGLNMGFMNNRIRIDAEYYDKKTNDLIQNVALPTSLGFESVTANVGKLVNRGIEISVNSVNIQNTNFNWSTTLNFSTNHNEILELYGGTVTRDIANNLFVGESLLTNYYYEFDGIWQLDEAVEAAKYGQIPGSVKVVDQNNDGKISSSADADDRVVLGNQLPKWIGGITNTFTYKNWDLSFMIYTRQGVQFRNSLLSGTMGELGSSRYNRLNLNYWTEDNPTNDYFGVWQSNPYRQAIQYKDASFWRISNLTLGYNLPDELLNRLKFSGVRCYIQANNLAVFTKEKNIWMDPEFNSGTYGDDVPNSTFIFGINLSF
ncbi:SusC/RagA family TonB-linked outer membrane protein [Sunxiuqinia sp. A32]|uniref:SusC/RagA family TonB-linked outer membrane protein n=1 Tax=Sunxiuqinia sp. A32 TaxID=3461496 RepID=UPI0040457B3C